MSEEENRCPCEVCSVLESILPEMVTLDRQQRFHLLESLILQTLRGYSGDEFKEMMCNLQMLSSRVGMQLYANEAAERVGGIAVSIQGFDPSTAISIDGEGDSLPEDEDEDDTSDADRSDGE